MTQLAPPESATVPIAPPGVVASGQIVTMGGVPFKVIKVERRNEADWITLRALTRLETWWLANRPRTRVVVAVALAVAGMVGLAVFLAGCTYEQRAVEQGGGLECKYDEANVCGGKFHLSGSCSAVIDLTGTWRLCRDADGVQCTLTSTRSGQ